MKKITSRDNPTLKHFLKLHKSKSYRVQAQSALIYGHKMIKELSTVTPIKTILTQQDSFSNAHTTYLVEKRLIEKITPIDAIAEVQLPKYQDIREKEAIIILDQIQDPGNLGTILRTALGLGFGGAHILSGCADPFNDKAVKAAKGVSFLLPLNEGPLQYPHTLYACDMEGEPIELEEPRPPYALIFGNEGSGVSPDLLRKSLKVAIRQTPDVESLGVASAAAIAMYLFRPKI